MSGQKTKETEQPAGLELDEIEAETVEALIAHPGSRAAAAEMLGIKERALRHRLMERPKIIQAIREHRRDCLRALAAEAQSDAKMAMQVFRDAMMDTTAPAAARVNAARLTLEVLIKLHEVDDLQDRIDQMEIALKESGLVE